MEVCCDRVGNDFFDETSSRADLDDRPFGNALEASRKLLVVLEVEGAQERLLLNEIAMNANQLR